MTTDLRATDSRAAGATLVEELRAAVRGDVWFDRATRAVYATDASNYRQVPIGVVCPVDADDVIAAMRICAAHDVPVLARGAGTSLAGQAVNEGVILDTSRHMRRILEIDPERRIARVEPGVVLDDLRREAERFGLTFGPDPATHAWCTIGGMIGNNSCGTHALVAGKTVDNVERLSVVTYGGAAFEVGAYDAAARAAAIAEGGERGRIVAALERLIDGAADAVRTGFPELPRRVSGYNLDELLPERGFHVARALVGTESTCVVVTEAMLRLIHIPAVRRLVVLAFPDVFAAADAVPALLAHPLLGLEGFDVTLTESMRARPLNVEHLALLPEGGAWLLAELGGDTDAEADEVTSAFVASLPVGQVSRRVDDAATQRALWLVRESGLGATAIRANGVHNLEGWEDGAVPPERLGEYLRGMTALWTEFGYSGAWYGHFGQGCVHTRNDFDLRTPDGLRQYRAYVERAADLVVSLGGSLSGEHGDGQSRGELLPRMFGPEVMDAFRAFKSAWDPRGRMNPGKVVDAYPLDTNLRHGPDHRASALIVVPAASGSASVASGGFAFRRDQGSLQVATERCVGVGRCRRDDAGVMCPSYRVTREEKHSTRGRAKLLGEMFQGDATPETWRNEDVREALDLCLSCKGCAVDCPTGVDVATYKAEFLHHHYRRRLRPRAAYALGLIPWTARLATRLPRIANAVLAAPVLGYVARRIGGITTRRPLPRFAGQPWRRSDVVRARQDRHDATVVVWPDTFTNAFAPGAGDDTVAVLEAAGERVAVPSGWGCCGRPLYDSGMLGVARGWLSQLVEVLDPWTSRDIPVVVPEPSCLAAFRDELPGLLGDDPRAMRLASLARSPAEHLIASGGAERLVEAFAGIARSAPAPAASAPGSFAASPGTSLAPPAPSLAPSAAPSPTSASPADPVQLVVHAHCHARASKAAAADVELARRLGFAAEFVDGGCCGLAGSFGFRAEHERLSRRIGEETWLPAIEEAIRAGAPDAELIVDGFSCATQLEHLDGPPAQGLLAVIRRELGAG